MKNNREKKYIANLTGLRGLAALMVFLYHINEGLFTGAFLAVDIFFILSGFLTIYHFNREYEKQGKISIIKYFKKRIVRIFPPLMLMMFTTYLFYAITAPYQLASMHETIKWAMAGIVNYHYIFEHLDYFTQNVIVNPFNHLWAIAIELQFYVIIPWVYLIILSRSKVDGKINFYYKRKNLFLYLFVFSAFFMYIGYRYTGGDTTVAYYGTISRISPLILGAYIGFNYHIDKANREYLSNKGFYNILTTLIIIILVVATFAIKGTTDALYQYGFVIADVFLAMLVWLLSSKENYLTPIFESKICKYLGTRSYGIFLWHMPLIALMQYQFSLKNTLFILIATLFFAEISYQGLDIASKKRRFILTCEMAKGLRISLFLIIGLGIYVYSIPVKQLSSFSEKEYINHANEMNYLSDTIKSFNTLNENPGQVIKDADDQFKYYVKASEEIADEQFIIVGDSVMRQIALTLPVDFTKDNKVDVQIGLQEDELVTKLVKYQDLDNYQTNVVFNVGNNGPVTKDNLTKIINMYQNSNIYILDVISDQEWRDKSSKTINKIADKYPSVHVVPVRKLSKDGDYNKLLLPDKLHYNEETVNHVKTLIIKTILDTKK